MRNFICSGLAVLAAAGTLAAFAASDPDRPEAPVTDKQSIASPILAFAGSKRMIAFHLPAAGRCSLRAVVWDEARASHRAGRISVSLRPNQAAHIDGDHAHSLELQCSGDARTVALANGANRVVFGAAD